MPVSDERVVEIRRQLQEHQQRGIEMMLAGAPGADVAEHFRNTPSSYSDDELRALADSIRQEAEAAMIEAYGGQDEWDLEQLIQATSRRARQESERSTAIVLAAAVDDRLTSALKRHFALERAGVAKRVRSMFDGANGSLGTFSARVDLGMALGLYNGRVRTALLDVAYIRNLFAHHIAVETFDHADLATEISKLAEFLKPQLDYSEDGMLKVVIRNGNNPVNVATGHRLENNPLDTKLGTFQQACYVLLQLLFQVKPGVEEPDLHLV